MSKRVRISIAIPFFNSGKWLPEAVLSVINQSYKSWEMFLIDDGSTDESLNIAQYFAKKDSRIYVISDGNNKGLAFRLNESVNLSNGDYYVRMDADDIMFPNRLELQLNYMESHPDLDVIGSSAIIIGQNNDILYGMNDNMRAPLSRKDVINGLIFVHPTVFGKRSWFIGNPYDESKRRSQDFFLWLSSVEHSKFAIIDEPLLFYRVANNDTWGKFKRDNRTMYNYFKSQLSLHNLFEPLKQCIRQQVRLPLFYLYYHLKGSEGVIRRRYRMLGEKEMKEYAKILNEIVNKRL